MNLGVTVDLWERNVRIEKATRLQSRTRGTGDQEAGLGALGETEHVEGTLEGRLERLDGVDLVVRGRGRAREMVDLCMEAVSGCYSADGRL